MRPTRARQVCPANPLPVVPVSVVHHSQALTPLLLLARANIKWRVRATCHANDMTVSSPPPPLARLWAGRAVQAVAVVEALRSKDVGLRLNAASALGALAQE